MSRLPILLFTTAVASCAHPIGEQPNPYTANHDQPASTSVAAAPPRPQGPPRSPKGSTRVVLVNVSIYSVCSITFGAPSDSQDNVTNWDPLTDQTATEHKLAMGRSMEVGLQPGRYSVEIESCDHKYHGSNTADVRGATAISIGHPGKPDPKFANLAQVWVELSSAAARAHAAKVRSGGGGPAGSEPKRDCLPGGDMSTGIASECCTGLILISAKRPNMPSHCAFPDEVE